MDLLGVVDLRHDVDDDAHDDHDHHSLLGAGSALDGAASLREDDGVALAEDHEEDDDESSLRQLSLRSAGKRRKIGKTLQLLLLRKYVQCAKQCGRIPDRMTTEHLLDEGYDEFYFQGGSLNEPRLGYTAFLKLVRNRRGEVMRQTRDLHSLAHGRTGSRRHQKEQVEIRSLVEELERVRQSHLRSPLDYEVLDASELRSEPSESAAVSAANKLMPSQPHVPAVAAAAVNVATGAGREDVLLSRDKLDLLLSMAQETLNAQKKILAEVRAIEQRLDM